eukprot:gene10202-8116_t
MATETATFWGTVLSLAAAYLQEEPGLRACTALKVCHVLGHRTLPGNCVSSGRARAEGLHGTQVSYKSLDFLTTLPGNLMATESVTFLDTVPSLATAYLQEEPGLRACTALK